MEDARASLDEGYERQKGQHGEFPEASVGLGQYGFHLNIIII